MPERHLRKLAVIWIHLTRGNTADYAPIAIPIENRPANFVAHPTLLRPLVPFNPGMVTDFNDPELFVRKRVVLGRSVDNPTDLSQRAHSTIYLFATRHSLPQSSFCEYVALTNRLE